MGTQDLLDADDLVRRYLSGESAASLQKRFRTHRSTINKILGEHGIQPRGRAEAARLATAKNIDSSDLIDRYQSGESVNALRKHFKVDAYVIRRVLAENEISIRGHADAIALDAREVDEDAIAIRYAAGESARGLLREFRICDDRLYGILAERGIPARGNAEANKLLASRLTHGQRASRAAHWREAWGRPICVPPFTPQHPARVRAAAATRESRLSMQRPDEIPVISLLPEGWVDGLQVAADFYNIDITHGRVAVEVHAGALHPFRARPALRRMIDLADLGWHVVYTWICKQRPLTPAGVTELVAHAERLDGDPSPQRQYVVVGGSGELVSAGRLEPEHRTVVPTPVDAQQPAERENARVAG